MFKWINRWWMQRKLQRAVKRLRQEVRVRMNEKQTTSPVTHPLNNGAGAEDIIVMGHSLNVLMGGDDQPRWTSAGIGGMSPTNNTPVPGSNQTSRSSGRYDRYNDEPSGNDNQTTDRGTSSPPSHDSGGSSSGSDSSSD